MDGMTNNNDNNNPKKEPWLRRALDAFGNMFALNLCFVAGCIPIITIGASLTALYAMCIRIQEDEEETIVAGFIHEFKRSFKQSTIAFLLILAAAAVMIAEYLVVKTVEGFYSTLYTCVLVVEIIVLALIVPFLFPLIARYDNKLSILIRNSAVLSITYLGSWIKVVVAWFAPIAFCIIYPEIFVYIWYLWLLLIFGAIAYGTSYTMRKVFRLNEQRIVDAKAREEAAKEQNQIEAEDDSEEAEAEPEEKSEKADEKKNDSEKAEADASDEQIVKNKPTGDKKQSGEDKGENKGKRIGQKNK